MTVSQAQFLAIFQRHQALVSDSHIVYTSGKHGRHYVNKDAIYPHTQDISQLCLAFAEHFKGQNIDAVVAPAIGGVILSTWTAHHLSQLSGREVLGLYAEKGGGPEGAFIGDFILGRGYDQLVRGKRVLLVEDVLNTGASLAKVAQCVKGHGAEVVGAAALCNRGGVKAAELGVPKLYSLVELDFEAWDANACPLCQQKVPINTTVGKGREFLRAQAVNK